MKNCSVVTIDGKNKNLNEYEWELLLIVNMGRKSKYVS